MKYNPRWLQWSDWWIEKSSCSKKLMGLTISFLTTVESWDVKGNCQEWHNTISKDKVERIALWNARWRILELLKTRHVFSTMFNFEYSLADHHLERNLEEQLKNEKIPWRTTKLSHRENSSNKRMIKWKGKLKRTPGEALQWLDEALKWYNWNNLDLRKEKVNNLEPRIWYHERTPEERINHLDEQK